MKMLDMFDNSVDYPKICRKEKRQIQMRYTVKPVLSSHSKIDKTKVLETNGSRDRSKQLQNAPF